MSAVRAKRDRCCTFLQVGQRKLCSLLPEEDIKVNPKKDKIPVQKESFCQNDQLVQNASSKDVPTLWKELGRGQYG